MTLKFTTKANVTKEARIAFEPPLSGYEEVKPRLLEMKVNAEEALGMVSMLFGLRDPYLTCVSFTVD